MMKFEKLNKIFTIQKGKKNTLVESPENDSIRVIQIDDLRNDNYIKYTNENKGLLVNEEDILIAWDGANVGTVGYGKKGYLGSTLAQLKIVNSNKYDSRYLGLFLKTKNDFFKKNSTGATIPHIHRNSLESLLIPIPENLVDQIRIAKVLTKTETLIKQRNESIDLLHDFLRSTFLEMFGDPVKNEKKWEKTNVGKYTDCIVPGRDKPKSFTGNIPWIRTEDLNNKSFFNTSKENIGLTIEEIKNVKGKIIPANSVIMTCVGQLNIISINKVECIINQQLHSFQCHKDLNNIFLMFALSFEERFMFANASTTTVAYMNKSICNSIPIIVPPIKLQNKFASIVEKAEKVKEHYIKSLKELENLFGSLSQKAFKGELDLSKMNLTETENEFPKTISNIITPQMQEFIRKTSELEKIIPKTATVINSDIYQQIARQNDILNQLSNPFKGIPELPESVKQALNTYENIKSISSTLNEVKKSTWSSTRDLGELEGLEFDETEGLALIEIVLSKNRTGFTFADFETLLQTEKFKYNYNQIQHFIFNLIAEKKITQHFLSNKLENRLLQLEEGNNEMFFGDESIWFKYNKS